jgi:glycosyltransferase involved in cell wall biosynthesis
VSEPAVSVVVPVRDGERYLREAIGSVLRQEPAPAEVIVVDDGSRDRSAEVAAACGEPVRVLRQSASGIGAARNRGVAAARGTHLAFVDADDVWEEGRLGPQLRLVAGPPAADLVFGGAEHFFSPELPAEARRRYRLPAGVQPAVLCGTLLARIDRFRAVGPFAEELATGELIEWMLRARAAGLVEAHLDARVLWRRVHGANHGIVRRDAAGDYLRVARAALARRRAGEPAS